MTASNVVSAVREPTATTPPPLGLWLAAVCYALLALAPAPTYLYFRSVSDLPPERWAGTTPFDNYLGVGLLYFGSAAACSYLLLKQRAAAVWPAAFIAVWRALEGVSAMRRVLLGGAEWSTLTFVGSCLAFGSLAMLALFVRRLRRQGVLQ